MSASNNEIDGSEPQDPRSRRLTPSLSSLYLDPNNFRFIDHHDFQQVPEDRRFNAEIQRRATYLVLGPSNENVRDLIASLKQNGWLEVDQIQVQRIDRGRYLVVEGNRRVATLKYLQRRHEEAAIDLGRLDPGIFSKVPVVLYEESDDVHHLVLMGLNHISGKRRWPAINQARLMKKLRDEFELVPDAICDSLGVTKREYNLAVRTLALCERYIESDYGDQFVSEKFNHFRELLKAPSIRGWIDWDPDQETARNEINLERLFSWMSREPEPEELTAIDKIDDVPLHAGGEPVITTVGHVRELARLIEDPDAVQRLDETRSLQEATLSSDLLVKNELESAFKRCEREATRIFQHSNLLTVAELDRLDGLISKFQGIASARNRQGVELGAGRPWHPFNEDVGTHFQALRIDRYRGLVEMSLERLGQVNLVAGINNAGKTSLLEAIYLLVRQSDPRAIIDVVQQRSRQTPGSADPRWLIEQLPREARVAGHFDKLDDNLAEVDLRTNGDPEDPSEDRTFYLGTLNVESRYAARSQSSETTFFENRPPRMVIEGDRWLSRVVLSSPFSLHSSETLVRYHRAGVEVGTKQKVLKFIRDHLDSGLRDIDLVDRYNRFLVTHDDFDSAPDLSTFGEGVQRIFHIGLLFAAARGGVLLIDELENAIHTSLLTHFTRFVQELAVEFNVQVFLTTHSKETVDAFAKNGYRTEDLVAFALVCEAGHIQAQRFDGPRLERLLDAIDFDIRRL